MCKGGYDKLISPLYQKQFGITFLYKRGDCRPSFLLCTDKSHFTDILPPGDLANIQAVFELNLLPEETIKNQIVRYMEKFKPFRPAATYLL